MGLLRRSTPGEIVEGGRLAGPAGRARIRAQLDKTRLRLRRPFGHCIKSRDVGYRMVRCSANPSPRSTSSAVVRSQARIRVNSTATGGARLAWYRRGGSSLPNSAPRATSSRARTSSSRSQHSCPSAQTARTMLVDHPLDRKPGQRPNSLTLEALPPDPLAGQDQLGAMADRAGGGHRFLVAPLQELLLAG